MTWRFLFWLGNLGWHQKLPNKVLQITSLYYHTLTFRLVVKTLQKFPSKRKKPRRMSGHLTKKILLFKNFSFQRVPNELRRLKFRDGDPSRRVSLSSPFVLGRNLEPQCKKEIFLRCQNWISKNPLSSPPFPVWPTETKGSLLLDPCWFLWHI